jgi:hypothetical protein
MSMMHGAKFRRFRLAQYGLANTNRSAILRREKLCLRLGAGTADGLVPRRVAMEAMESAFSGPLMYLLVIWGVVTAIFLVLIAWRSLLSSHEDDQIFIDAAQDHMAREQRELITKIESLSKPILTSGVTSGVLLLLIAGIFVYHGLKNF